MQKQNTQDHPHGLGVARGTHGDHGAQALTASGLPAGRVLAAFALTTEVEALISACLAELQLVIPQLRPWRGRISGRRVLGAHSRPEHGADVARGAGRGVTRIDLEFEVEIDPASPDVVALACHSTVRGRDRETTRTRIPVSAASEASGGLPAQPHGPTGRQRVTHWVEEALLDFATEWFQARRRESEQLL